MLDQQTEKRRRKNIRAYLSTTDSEWMTFPALMLAIRIMSEKISDPIQRQKPMKSMSYN